MYYVIHLHTYQLLYMQTPLFASTCIIIISFPYIDAIFSRSYVFYAGFSPMSEIFGSLFIFRGEDLWAVRGEL